MKKYILPAAKLSLVFLIICSVAYPLFIAAIGRLTPGKGNGETLSANGRVVGYALIGQKFDQDKYFWSRPSAASFNAAGSSGSNKGPSNPDYTPLEEIPQDTRNAVMTSEDPTFYSNNGFVEESIRKSIATDFKKKSQRKQTIDSIFPIWRTGGQSGSSDRNLCRRLEKARTLAEPRCPIAKT